MDTETKPFFIETDRLLIRQIRDDDLETFLTYRNDPEVAKYQGWSTPIHARRDSNSSKR